MQELITSSRYGDSEYYNELTSVMDEHLLPSIKEIFNKLMED